MPFASSLSTTARTPQALAEVCTALDTGPDLAVVFFSAHHQGEDELIARTLRDRLQAKVVIGCVAETVIGTGREIENGPALSVWTARWPAGVTGTPFHLILEQTSEGPTLLGWPDALVERKEGQRDAVLLLGDPYSFPTDLFLEQMNEDFKGVPVLGGMASGVRGPGQCRLLFGGEVLTSGAVGILLQGDVGLRWIVSQGCRPVGMPFVITRAEGNVIYELGGKTPLEQLRAMWDTLPEQDQLLFRGGPHLGRVINEYQATFQRGDFLVRNLVGIDPQSGKLIVADGVRTGQTVQFHVRDAVTADEDLHALLRQDRGGHTARPTGALLFSCNGRGTQLFKAPDHDASVIQQELGDIPLAGLFAMGELGPVGGQNFIHGFTASVAIFSE